MQELTVLSNEELQIIFKSGYQEFRLQMPISQLCPVLWSIVQRFLIAFPSSYLAERGFSAVATLVTKKRNVTDPPEMSPSDIIKIIYNTK